MARRPTQKQQIETLKLNVQRLEQIIEQEKAGKRDICLELRNVTEELDAYKTRLKRTTRRLYRLLGVCECLIGIFKVSDVGKSSVRESFKKTLDSILSMNQRPR